MKRIVVVLIALLACGVAHAGLFDSAKAGGFALIEMSGDDSIQLKPGLVLELVNDIADVGCLEIGLAGDSKPIGILGGSVSVKKLAEKRGWGYVPHKEEVFIGLCAGYMPDTEKFMYGLYGSVRF